MYNKLRILTLAVIVFIFALPLTSTAQSGGNEQGRPDVPGILLVDVGFNQFNNNDLDTMDLHWWGSKVVNISYLFEFKVTENLYFLPGIGLGLDRYRFDNPVTLTTTFDNPDTTMVVSLESFVGEEANIKNTKLIVNYFDVPLEFRYYANPSDKARSFKVGIGGKIGILYAAHTKINYKFNDHLNKIKEKKDFNINRFRYGVSARLGYGSFSLFGYYALNPLFEKGEGPAGSELSNFSFGLSFVGF